MKRFITMIVLTLLLCSANTKSISAQTYPKCPQIYITYARISIEAKDYPAALLFLQKQRRFYPNCPESEEALYLIIRVYHEMVLKGKQRRHIDTARNYIIEYTETFSDTSRIGDIKMWWTQIDSVDKSMAITAREFWQLVGSVVILVVAMTLF